MKYFVPAQQHWI